MIQLNKWWLSYYGSLGFKEVFCAFGRMLAVDTCVNLTSTTEENKWLKPWAPHSNNPHWSTYSLQLCYPKCPLISSLPAIKCLHMLFRYFSLLHLILTYRSLLSYPYLIFSDLWFIPACICIFSWIHLLHEDSE